MLALLLSWIILLAVTLTWGDILIYWYNKICKQSKSYNIFEKTILGLVALVIPLSAWSLFFPSNEQFLLLCIIISIIHWIIRRTAILHQASILREKYRTLSAIQIGTIIFIVATLFIGTCFSECMYDSAYYHYQNIRWNEEYAIIPGLANLDHRLGFNSNYLLLSAIFSLRFIFGEAIYGLQSFVLSIFIIWLLYEVYTSKFELKRVIILGIFFLFQIQTIHFTFDTSTDLLPNLIGYYIVAMIILYTDAATNKKLFLLIVPCFMVTCKLTFAPFVILTFYVGYLLLKKQNYSVVVWGICIIFCMSMLWFIRNIILTGYLIFPVYNIDVFNFDWKLPKIILEKEVDYIKSFGHVFFKISTTLRSSVIGLPKWINEVRFGTYIATIIGIILFIINISTKRSHKLPIPVKLMFLILLIGLVIWYNQGPDPRFVTGILTGIIALGLSSLWIKNPKEVKIKIVGFTLIFIYLLVIGGWNIVRVRTHYNEIIRAESSELIRKASTIVIKPYPAFNYMMRHNPQYFTYNYYQPYTLNNDIIIYLTQNGLTYEKLPATADMQNNGSKWCDHKLLEARGASLQNGFRHKSPPIFKKE